MVKYTYEIWQKEDWPSDEPRLVATLPTKIAVLRYMGWTIDFLNEMIRYKHWCRNVYGVRTKVVQKLSNDYK